MEWIILAVVGLLSGICAALGIGGGFVLLLYLTVIEGMPQREAQLLNLLFFLPIGVLSLIFHIRRRLVDVHAVWPAAVGGVAGVLLGVWISSAISSDWLGRLFAVFILGIGLRELFARPSQGESS